MAETWLQELFLRECKDGSVIEDWITKSSGIQGLSLNKVAEFYPQIFERRFRGDPELGYATLEQAMENKEPSFGYSLLAEIMNSTRHKVVVTTNFDNLVADTLAMHAYKPPLIVGHESLTGFVRPQLRRPLVAKIHRDLFLHPKNDQTGVDKLEKGWQEALQRLFQHYMPVVIGYGGNDGSLMGFLQNLPPGSVVGRMIWCHRAGSQPSESVCAIVSKHRGVFVEIEGFDEFMLRLAATIVNGFDMANISSRIEKLGIDRAAKYRQQAETLQARLQQPKNNGPQTPNTADLMKSLANIFAQSVKNTDNWWTWTTKANNEPDLQKRDAIYTAGIAALPNSATLKCRYADFVFKDLKDIKKAEEIFNEGIKLENIDVLSRVNYADFVADGLKQLERADSLYKEIIASNENDDYAHARYGSFLHKSKKDTKTAEIMSEEL